MPRLPITQARSALSIKLFLIKSSYLTPDILKVAPGRISEFAPIPIDGVEKFMEHETRETDPRYENDADISGNIVGRVRKITTKIITIDRTVMYANDVGDLFDVGGELINENIPFAILKIETAPPSLNIPNKVTMFMNCFIHSLPKSFELGRDLKVIQTISLGYTDKIKLDANVIS